MPRVPVDTPTGSDRATRSRAAILRAARSEFAAVGMGGGRIERIATSAGINRERIYAYFGDKRGLFAAALGSAVHEVAEALVDAPTDVPSFAEYLFDFLRHHVETVRLLAWAGLERDDPWHETEPFIEDVPQAHAFIAQIQGAGGLSSSWNPRDVFAMIWALSSMGILPPYPDDEDPAAAGRRRKLVHHVVSSLVDDH